MMILRLSLIMGLAGKSLIKGLMMGMLGIFLSMIGMETGEGIPRLTLDSLVLALLVLITTGFGLARDARRDAEI